MRGFDTVLVIDWSAAQGVRRVEKDAIWIGISRDDVSEDPIPMPTRHAAEDWLRARLHSEIAAGRRVMAGFDFPFGYPAGMARIVTGTDDPLRLWDWLAERVTDDEKGRNNRFEVASALNRMFPGIGPFWGKPDRDAFPDIPHGGLARQGHGMAEKRVCDRAARASSSVWQLAFPPTVGSQVLMGLPVLSRLRRIDGVAVWPFEKWQDAPAVLTEIWPGLIEDALPPRGEGIRDSHQVRLLAHALAALPAGELAAMMEVHAPEEGWILGAGHRARLTDLARDGRPDSGRATAPPPLADDCFALPPGIHWTPVNEALAVLRDRLHPVAAIETVPLDRADGRILATAPLAPRANPPGANAAVDGYGFAHGALSPGAQDLQLVDGRAAAGAPHAGVVPEKHAVRILTGALVPAGVDTIVMQEDCTVASGRVRFAALPKAGANTRRAGEDVVAGTPILESGQILRPPDLALAAAVGQRDLEVFARLRVGVLSTGDELAAPGSTDDPARTYDANRPMLLALATRWGHEAVDLGCVGDDRDALRATLDAARARADVVLTSGGASAGEEDHVSALLRKAGSMQAWRIALKPGRPLALGLWSGMPVFGLPGNPVAALVCALIFARPALSRMGGGAWSTPVGFDVPAGFAKRKKAGRREYLRARIREGRAEVFASEGSGRISGLAWAEGLVELPEPAMTVAPGDPVRFLPYGSFGL
ncbi:gephyrin-like molybdotransferase Glp [Oceaniglobus indicus]|uniref:molybdopterin-binding protein n=1 Tax=Oceaniglobus indicus TaxID=2047749 RepID=UPI000C179059|nr:gephyrin-like molybdotransferase Glp [Oceaniglobus indicus]